MSKLSDSTFKVEKSRLLAKLDVSMPVTSFNYF